MTTQIRDGQEFHDGKLVEQHRGHFTGKFDLDEDVSVGIKSGDLVCFLITGRMDGVGYKSIKNSPTEMRDTSFTLEDVVPLDPDKAAFIADQIKARINGVNDGFRDDGSLRASEDELSDYSNDEITDLQPAVEDSSQGTLQFDEYTFDRETGELILVGAR